MKETDLKETKPLYFFPYQKEYRQKNPYLDCLSKEELNALSGYRSHYLAEAKGFTTDQARKLVFYRWLIRGREGLLKLRVVSETNPFWMLPKKLTKFRRLL